MKNYLLSYAEKFDALSRRERIMLMAVCVMVLVAGMDTFVIQPVMQRHRELQSQLADASNQLASLQRQAQVLAQIKVVDPDAENRVRLANLNADLQQVNETLNRMQLQLVGPERMPGLLEDVLKQYGQLHLVSLKTMPESEVKVGAGGNKNNAMGSIFRHGVELKVRGRYLDLMAYLQALEDLPWHLRWGSFSVAMEQYPQATLSLTIYTLSLDKTWLTI